MVMAVHSLSDLQQFNLNGNLAGNEQRLNQLFQLKLFSWADLASGHLFLLSKSILRALLLGQAKKQMGNSNNSEFPGSVKGSWEEKRFYFNVLSLDFQNFGFPTLDFQVRSFQGPSAGPSLLGRASGLSLRLADSFLPSWW